MLYHVPFGVRMRTPGSAFTSFRCFTFDVGSLRNRKKRNRQKLNTMRLSKYQEK